jgi:peroxiredoxin
MLRAGDPAPDFMTLPELESGANPPGQGTPILVAFFKISCPVCQFTFPFLERLHQRATTGFRVLGISQDDKESTREFNEELGITLPMRLEQRGFKVSNAYRIDHVPTMFLVSGDSKVLEAETGFSKAFLEKMAQLAGLEGPLFLPGERIPAYRPG